MVKLDESKVRWIINQKIRIYQTGRLHHSMAYPYAGSRNWVRYGQIKPADISYLLPMGRGKLMKNRKQRDDMRDLGVNYFSDSTHS